MKLNSVLPGSPLVTAKIAKLKHLRGLQTASDAYHAERLAKIDVFAVLGYKPHPQQEAFHAATEDDVLYGGAAGGGKSVAIVMEGLRACARHPGMRVLLVRRTYDELAESVFPVLAKFGYGASLGAHWNGSERELRFPNGSLFRFRYMENLVDASRRQGGQYQLLLVDEATLMPPGVVDILKFERLRSDGTVPVIGTRSTCNPGGPSHAQVKARYIDGTAHGQHTVADDQGLTVRFVQAKATDNPHLDAGYAKRLNAIPDPQRRAAMRDGDWDQFAGMMFPEWRHERHTLEPIALPATWRRYNGIDWGYTAPWCVLWGAIDEDRRVWIYRELYKTQVGESEQAKQILAAESPDEHVAARYADDAMWATRGEAKAVATVYAENGVPLTAAGKGGRVSGWQRFHSYLADGPACAHHRALGWDECPRLHVFSTCTELIRTLPALPHAPSGDPEDADTKAEDHAPDAGRYLLINMGNEPRFHFPTPDPEAPVLDPSATGQHDTQRLHVPTIGGFPLLTGGDPWA
ncbi:phage terminase large subunit [Streptomyces sp. H10-C2]|uniref:phage terminase large subunit n=1 Tax=unclassified Streptomyces TaxID=2593676 RepID=UPI0024BA7F7B|nr:MULTISPECIES: phage terminase large subunit [unclassified Streptomyces]MDJ0342278.1 phage terminase large subunit [Streptomyces sp. PH10-H1]MDJ0368792.1 phage terminase large subunit [Streptomyces sp. H10-C2]